VANGDKVGQRCSRPSLWKPGKYHNIYKKTILKKKNHHFSKELKNTIWKQIVHIICVKQQLSNGECGLIKKQKQFQVLLIVKKVTDFNVYLTV